MMNPVLMKKTPRGAARHPLKNHRRRRLATDHFHSNIRMDPLVSIYLIKIIKNQNYNN
jgi:hypothetical protein